MGKKRYMELLLEQIRNKKAKEMISGEVEGHIDDQIAAYRRKGMTENEAEKKAVFEMGDPVEIGESLDRIHKPQMSWSMIVLVGILSALGLLLQWSIQNIGRDADITGYQFQNQILYIVIGFAVMMLICFIDYSVICKWVHVLSVCFLALCVWYTGSGVGVNGSKRYLNLPGGLSLAFHAVIYLAIPLFAALLYYHRNGGRRQLIIPIGFIVLAVFLFSQSAGSLVISMNLILMAEIILGLAVFRGWFPVKKKMLFPVALILNGIPVIVLFLRMLTGPVYLLERMQVYFPGNSQAYAYGQSSVADLLAKCQVIGGTSEAYPEVTDILGVQCDYVLLHVASSYGILILLAVIALLVGLCCKMFFLTLCQKNRLGMMLGVGCSLIFLFQIIEYIMMNLGFLPPTTVFLPLFSCGGSGTVVSYILLGILLSVYRYQNLIPEHRLRKKRRLVVEFKEY